eukprot:TRINITY_DN12247_c0_g1_i1.p1 TRINITY_DN12247_c0_g1~~TRINITY_DN12247_c0_g1_i1.p1  ORF type:complete len:192 (+),score=34.75 TRINITY_DN12247_c0_g1_i1:2-577(+)
MDRLFEAAQEGDVNVLRISFEETDLPENWDTVWDEFGQSIFHSVCEVGDFQSYNFLLEHLLFQKKTLDENLDENGSTVLAISILGGSKEIVESISHHFPHLKMVKDKTGALPVHYACYHGYTDYIHSFFLDQIHEIDDQKWSTLHYAVSGNHLDTVKLLLRLGVNNQKSALNIAIQRNFFDIINLLQNKNK